MTDDRTDLHTVENGSIFSGFLQVVIKLCSSELKFIESQKLGIGKSR